MLLLLLPVARCVMPMPRVQARIHQLQDGYFAATAKLDAEAAALLSAGKAKEAIEKISAFGVATGEQARRLARTMPCVASMHPACNGRRLQATSDWRAFWMSLFVRHRDGMTTTPPTKPVCKKGATKGCTARPLASVNEGGYTDGWCAAPAATPPPHTPTHSPPPHTPTHSPPCPPSSSTRRRAATARYARIVADGDNAAHYGVPAQHAGEAARAAGRRKVLAMDKRRA